MPLIITKKPITTLPVQGFFCMWNQQQTDASMLSIMEKWSVKRAVKKLENGRDFAKTGAYHFSAKYIVHIKEPKNTGSGDRKQPVTALFSQCLKYAHDQLMDSIALPLWSSAFADLSAIEVYQTAVDTIRSFLERSNITVYLCIKSERVIELDESLVDEISEKVKSSSHTSLPTFRGTIIPKPKGKNVKESADDVQYCIPDNARYLIYDPDYSEIALLIRRMSKQTFSDVLLQLIDVKGVTAADCYKKANIERSLFSKIKSNPYYRPSKTTVVAFALALELSMAETELLLKKAGYSFSDAIPFDIIIRFCIENKIYDIYKVNDILFAYGQPILGSK